MCKFCEGSKVKWGSIVASKPYNTVVAARGYAWDIRHKQNEAVLYNSHRMCTCYITPRRDIKFYLGGLGGFQYFNDQASLEEVVEFVELIFANYEEDTILEKLKDTHEVNLYGQKCIVYTYIDINEVFKKETQTVRALYSMHTV